MAQLVGKACAKCGRKIAYALGAIFCPTCGAPVHEACAPPDLREPEACSTCGAAKHSLAGAARAPERPDAPGTVLPPPNQDRAWGVYMICVGLLLLFVFPDGWLINGIPVSWFGALLAVLGLWPLLFPRSAFFLRERATRLEETHEVWDRPGAAGPARKGPGSSRVEGVYDTPAFSIRERPFPITGTGHMAFARKGVEVSAFSVATSLRNIGLLAAITLVVGGVLIVIVVGQLEWLFLVALGAGIWASLSRVRAGRAREGDPLTHKIPWECVVGIQVTADDRVLVLVERTKPRGEIHFQPDDIERFLDALQECGCTVLRPR